MAEQSEKVSKSKPRAFYGPLVQHDVSHPNPPVQIPPRVEEIHDVIVHQPPARVETAVVYEPTKITHQTFVNPDPKIQPIFETTPPVRFAETPQLQRAVIGSIPAKDAVAPLVPPGFADLTALQPGFFITEAERSAHLKAIEKVEHLFNPDDWLGPEEHDGFPYYHDKEREFFYSIRENPATSAGSPTTYYAVRINDPNPRIYADPQSPSMPDILSPLYRDDEFVEGSERFQTFADPLSPSIPLSPETAPSPRFVTAPRPRSERAGVESPIGPPFSKRIEPIASRNPPEIPEGYGARKSKMVLDEEEKSMQKRAAKFAEEKQKAKAVNLLKTSVGDRKREIEKEIKESQKLEEHRENQVKKAIASWRQKSSGVGKSIRNVKKVGETLNLQRDAAESESELLKQLGPESGSSASLDFGPDFESKSSRSQGLKPTVGPLKYESFAEAGTPSNVSSRSSSSSSSSLGSQFPVKFLEPSSTSSSVAESLFGEEDIPSVSSKESIIPGLSAINKKPLASFRGPLGQPAPINRYLPLAVGQYSPDSRNPRFAKLREASNLKRDLTRQRVETLIQKHSSKHQKQYWTCDECNFSYNEASANTCALCGAPKPGARVGGYINSTSAIHHCY